jgi:hypothetical protein
MEPSVNQGGGLPLLVPYGKRRARESGVMHSLRMRQSVAADCVVATGTGTLRAVFASTAARKANYPISLTCRVRGVTA